MLSEEGRCKTLDAGADGYVRAEGAGCIILLRSDSPNVAEQLAQGGFAILSGTAVNQDGRSSSLTAPNGPSQQSVMRAAMKAGHLEPKDLGRLEMHGTGTPLGDPIEIGAASAVLASSVPANDTAVSALHLSALKSHMGHAEPAAGILGIVRLKEQIDALYSSPILHLRHVNPYLDSSLLAARRSFAMPRQPAAWAQCKGAAAGGVSSFAFMGTNAHAIVSASTGQVPASQQPAPLVKNLQRLYVVPRVHPLVSQVRACRPAGSLSAWTMAVECHISSARLASIYDHRVMGRWATAARRINLYVILLFTFWSLKSPFPL